MKSYSRTFDDELDWQLLDQLHRVVLQISGFCFRTKQICLTVDIAVAGILFKINNNNIDETVFMAGMIIPLSFWFLDSVAYFYQVKIRTLMEKIRKQLKERNKESLVHGVTHVPIISAGRIEKSWSKNAWDAFANHSMWLYGLLLVADLTLWLAHSKGAFGI